MQFHSYLSDVRRLVRSFRFSVPLAALLLASTASAQNYRQTSTNEAQAVINSMPAGPLKDSCQAALDAFKSMDGQGKVGVDPNLGNGAATTAEGPGGSTSGVGAGGEVIELGPLVAGEGLGPGPYMDPTYSGCIYMHEGQRCLQTYSVGPGGAFVNPWQCVQYHLNEAQVYFMDAYYWFAVKNRAIGAGNEPEANRAERIRNKRAKRAWSELAKILDCF